MSIITVENLSKAYGKNVVFKDTSFSLPKGEIIGLLGPNGCGKSTFMKILTGLIHDYTGKVLINGEVPSEKTKAFTAYLPEQSFVHDWMRNIDAIDYFNDFFSDFDKAKALEMLTFFELDPNKKAKKMSKGMQEKLLLSLTMSRNAQLYILDEPMGGVDPATRSSILEFIMKNYAHKSTLLISTHLINDLEEVFSHVVFMDDGKILLNDKVSEITKNGKSVNDIFKEVFTHVW